MMNLKYTDGTLTTDHLNAFQGIINQLAGMNVKFEVEMQGLWLLGSLPDSWETFRTSLSNSAPDGVITVDLAKSSVLNEEMRRKSQGSFAQSDILVIEKNGRSKSRGPKFKERGRSKSNKFANVECYNCGMKGHISRLCRKPKKDDKKITEKRRQKMMKMVMIEFLPSLVISSSFMNMMLFIFHLKRPAGLLIVVHLSVLHLAKTYSHPTRLVISKMSGWVMMA